MESNLQLRMVQEQDLGAQGVRMTYFSLYTHVFFGLGLALGVSLGFPS